LPAERLPEPGDLSPSSLEEAIETGRFEVARGALDRQEPVWAGLLSRAIVGTGPAGGRPGYLVLNPLGLPRRAAVLLPEAAPDLRPEGPLRAAQFTDEGVWAVVDLPAFGYAWVPRETSPTAEPNPKDALSARDRVLRNEAMEVEVDPTTGGIRSLRAPREETARLGQQIVITGVAGAMRARSFEVEYAGPALVQAVSRGVLIDPRETHERPLAAFRQRYRLWSGRPILELEVELSDLDQGWHDRLIGADPWSEALSCRWAWPDPNSMLRRTSLLAPELTEADRPETPDALDISTRRQRTAILFGGLAHHQKHGARMLDTLLIAGREAGRRFALGVALDLEHPFHAALDLVTPTPVVPTEAGPPSTGPTGWMVQVDSKAVAITRLEYADPSGDGRGWGLVLHLTETAGRPARCRVRLFRTPVWARQVDFNDELIVDLSVDGDAVHVDLTPHEIARIDITLG
jgi:alpha-mannosidase